MSVCPSPCAMPFIKRAAVKVPTYDHISKPASWPAMKEPGYDHISKLANRAAMKELTYDHISKTSSEAGYDCVSKLASRPAMKKPGYDHISKLANRDVTMELIYDHVSKPTSRAAMTWNEAEYDCVSKPASRAAMEGYDRISKLPNQAQAAILKEPVYNRASKSTNSSWLATKKLLADCHWMKMTPWTKKWPCQACWGVPNCATAPRYVITFWLEPSMSCHFSPSSRLRNRQPSLAKEHQF